MSKKTLSDFAIAYKPLKQFEGGYCDVPQDFGGETYAGIARKFWPEWSGWKAIDEAKKHSSFARGWREFTAHLRTIPALDEAVESFYYENFWQKMHLAQLPQEVANEIFEQAVNLGVGGSGRYVQRLCNALNYDDGNMVFKPNLIEDGLLGPKSIEALRSIITKHDHEIVVHGLNALQAMHYINKAAKVPSQRIFTVGWLSRT